VTNFTWSKKDGREEKLSLPSYAEANGNRSLLMLPTRGAEPRQLLLPSIIIINIIIHKYHGDTSLEIKLQGCYGRLQCWILFTSISLITYGQTVNDPEDDQGNGG